jgi:hypothetical protein
MCLFRKLTYPIIVSSQQGTKYLVKREPMASFQRFSRQASTEGRGIEIFSLENAISPLLPGQNRPLF